MKHAFAEILEAARLPATGWGLYQANGAAAVQGRMFGWGTVIGLGIQGWAPGALFLDLDAAAGVRLLKNEGSNTAASFVAFASISAAQTWALLQTFTLGVAVTSADLLTVAGVIVPQFVYIDTPIVLHASKVYYHLHTFRDAMKLVDGDWVGDVAQNITGTIVKASSTTAPSSGTTPCITANTLNLNTTASTIQNIIASFTVTVADRTFAVGDRCALTVNAALTSGSGMLSLKFQRV